MFFFNKPSLSVHAALTVSVSSNCFLPEGGEEAPPCLGGYVLLRFVVTLFEQFQHCYQKTNQVEREAWRWVEGGGGGVGRGTLSPSYSVSRSLARSHSSTFVFSYNIKDRITGAVGMQRCHQDGTTNGLFERERFLTSSLW